MVYLLILFCVLCAPFTHSSQISDYRTKYEIRNIFDQDEVPEHEIVEIYHKFDKSGLNKLTLKTKINGMDIEYYLNPIGGFLAGSETKVWTVKKNGQKLDYTLHKNAMKDALANFYHDEESMSSISHSKDENGNSLFFGTIDFDKEVRPMPESFRYRRDLIRNFSPMENNEKTFTKTVNHIVFKKPVNQTYHRNNTNSKYEHEKNVLRKRRDLKMSELGAPLVVYPEIMIFQDEKLFARFDKNVGKTVQYLLAFWNGVDLRYRVLKDPKVFLNIAGIILAEEELPFMKIRYEVDREMINGSQCLNDFSKFLYNETEIQLKRDYDVVFLMTDRDMYSNQSNNQLGLAYAGGACQIDNNSKRNMAVGIFEDNNDYLSVIAAAHELAHLLGVLHDSDTTIESIGGPGAKACSWDDGYIMSYRRINKNKIYFSHCSQQSMFYFLSRQRADCLRDNPADKNLVRQMPRILPGKYMSLDEQCQKNGYPKAFNKNSSACIKLLCVKLVIEKNGKKIRKLHDVYSTDLPAAEGSSCGVNMICLDGECIEDITEYI